MSTNKTFRFGPIALNAVLTTDLLNPPSASGGVNAGASPNFITLKHVRITNRSAAVAATFSLWLGASGANAAGTEFIGSGVNVSAGSAYDWYSSGARLNSDDFLVGGASSGTLTISGEGEIGVA